MAVVVDGLFRHGSGLVEVPLPQSFAMKRSVGVAENHFTMGMKLFDHGLPPSVLDYPLDQLLLLRLTQHRFHLRTPFRAIHTSSAPLGAPAIAIYPAKKLALTYSPSSSGGNGVPGAWLRRHKS